MAIGVCATRTACSISGVARSRSIGMVEDPMSTRKQIRATDRRVGKRIRMRRLMMKMGQTELGRRLGLTAMAVSKYERGEIRIGASRLQEISTILQVTPAFFFERTSTRVQRKTKGEKRRWPDHVTDLMATPDGLALAKAFAEIKDLGFRRRIIRLVVELAASKGSRACQ
jgi:transcriptional regulator with XRE-family HTH domain